MPLVVSVVAIVWLFRWADGLTSGLESACWDREAAPGTGILATALIVLVAGLVATNVLGRRLLQRAEQILLHVPLFRTIYAPVKQLISAFSPDSEAGFKRVVLRRRPGPGVRPRLPDEGVHGRPRAGPEVLLAVYVPTNHLYLGDVVLCPPERTVFPRMTVQEGIRVFLTGGMALPDHVSAWNRSKSRRRAGSRTGNGARFVINHHA